MAYERKIYDKISCPRCTYSKAELRLDVIKPTSGRYLVYLVCPVCRFSQYQFATNKKAIALTSRIEKLRKSLLDLDPKTNRARSVRASIVVLLRRRREQEMGA